MSTSDRGAMRDDDWTSLVYAVERGECILMIGRDAVLGTFDGERMPLLVGLARIVKQRLIELHGPKYEYLDPTNPAAVAQVAIQEEDHPTLQGWVRDFYDGIEGESPVLSDLAALPFPLVVSTSPGLSVDRAFKAAKPGTHVDFYDRTEPAHGSFADPTAQAPLVYNLYGSLTQPRSLILSDSDRIDFLVSVISGDPPLPVKLMSALRDPARSLLFLGFRLFDWQLRVLTHVLARGVPRQLKSFAFELEEAGVDAGTRNFYKSGHKIGFYDMDVETFAAELRTRVSPEAAAATPMMASDELGPGAPIVFLCHASEDHDYAGRLAEDLRSGGIRTWLDKEELRGGDNWDDKIRSTIFDEVSYVVVIQSASLKSKDIGYVNREINIALDRQQEYRPPRRFLIPIVVDRPESRLENLESIQSIDFSQGGSVEDLVKEIKRDIGLEAREG